MPLKAFHDNHRQHAAERSNVTGMLHGSLSQLGCQLPWLQHDTGAAWDSILHTVCLS